MKTVRAGVLDVAYMEVGPADGPAIILLHGFPYDIHSFNAVAAKLAGRGCRCLVPYLRGYGDTRFLSAETMRSGQQGALAADLMAFMDALGLDRAVLGGNDWGGRAACIVASLWPDRVVGLLSCGSGYNIQNIPAAGLPASPQVEHSYWYQYYFHSERGRKGLRDNRDELCRYIWRLWSPDWAFDEATYKRSAAAFENPDFMEVVVHSYRHRFGLVPGDPAYAAIELALETQPEINVPAIILQGASDGVDPPGGSEMSRSRFTALKGYHVLAGIGHNPPQEAPDVFADHILALLDSR